MSTTAIEPELGAPTSGGGTTTLANLEPLRLVPVWVLWTVIFWENCVNLWLDAPYTEQFITAPIFVAGFKFLFLALAAIAISRIQYGVSEWKPNSKTLLRNWLDLWLISSVVMAVLTRLQPSGTLFERESGSSDPAQNPDFYLNQFSKLSRILFGLIGAAITQSCVALMRS